MSLQVSVLASGSSGNSIYITSGDRSILIDAGLSGKKIVERLNKCGVNNPELDAILMTHEHKDHTKGVGVLSRRFKVPIYANELTWTAAAEDLGKIKSEHQCLFDGDFMIGDLGILPFSISHDAKDPVGYIIKYKNKSIGIATDMGCIPERVKKKLIGLDFLILEANHDLEMLQTGPYPAFLKKRIRSDKGHLSNDDTADLLPQLVKDNFPCILLAHLSKDNNIPKVAHITIKNNLEEAGLKLGKDLKMDFAYRDKPTQLYDVKKSG